MTPSEGMTWLAIVAVAGVIVIIVTALTSLGFRRGLGLRRSLTPPLLAVALSVIAVAFTHVWIGGRIATDKRSGLWAEGSITAFPTSLTALGATFISLWVVLWTAENSVRTTQRHDQTIEAEQRRKQGADLVLLMDSLDDSVRPLRSWWMGDVKGLGLWSSIDGLWRHMCDGGLGEPASLGPNDYCRNDGHRVALPDTNCLTPADVLDRTTSGGCLHFAAEVEARLADMQISAMQIAANKVTDANRVRNVLAALSSLLDKYGLKEYDDLVSDARRLSKYYPETSPDPSSADGKKLLAQIMNSVYLAATMDGRWDREIRAEAAKHGVVIKDHYGKDNRDRWVRVQNSAEVRSRFRNSLLESMRENDTVVGAGLPLDFWNRIYRSG
ncbi:MULTISPECIES: hypothetical protein [unclassified Kribbella]|uniref:hypothetical protein n=1 Tax=unclassified Kribbella TaxID=2644121 RepID=UPI003077EFBE